MKTITAKAGLIITFLLVCMLVAYGVTQSKRTTNFTIEDDSIEETRCNDARTGINFKGMTRHILDLYK